MKKEYNEVRFSSGGGPDWREIGYTLGRHLAEREGLHGYDLVVQTTGHNMSMENPAVVGRKEADISIDFNVVVQWARDGIEPFEKEYEELRGIATIPQYNLQMKGIAPVVRADLGIETYQDLIESDHELTLKTNHPETHVNGVAFGQILQEYGSSWDDLLSRGCETLTAPDGYLPKLSTGEAILEVMKEDELDGGWRLDELWQVGKEMELNILSLDDEIAKRLEEKYNHMVVDVQSDFLFEGQEKFTTLGYPGQFIFTHKDVPDELAYAVAEVLNEQSLDFASCQPGLVGVPNRHLSRMWGVPMHSGAEEYYKSLSWL